MINRYLYFIVLKRDIFFEFSLFFVFQINVLELYFFVLIFVISGLDYDVKIWVLILDEFFVLFNFKKVGLSFRFIYLM